MRSRIGNRLPKFTTKETALVNGLLDFVGINHYNSFYAKGEKSTIIDKLLNNTLADTGIISLRELIGLIFCSGKELKQET
jgi:beta-glucosidase